LLGLARLKPGVAPLAPAFGLQLDCLPLPLFGKPHSAMSPWRLARSRLSKSQSLQGAAPKVPVQHAAADSCLSYGFFRTAKRASACTAASTQPACTLFLRTRLSFTPWRLHCLACSSDLVRPRSTLIHTYHCRLPTPLEPAAAARCQKSLPTRLCGARGQQKKMSS
jgi:hypothetical protein